MKEPTPAAVRGDLSGASFRKDQAKSTLEQARRRHPGDRDTLDALLDYAVEAGDGSAAARWRSKREALGR